MHKNLDRKGFSVVEVLIAIVVIAAIAACGWLAWRHNHKDKTQAASHGATSNSTAKSDSSSTAKTQYMTIAEWGVKMPLSTPIASVYYVVSNQSEDANGRPDTLWLGLKSITSASCTPTASNVNNTEFASIFRALPTDTDPVSGTLYTQLYPGGATVNGYYYALDDARTLESNCASQSTLQSIDTALKAAVAGIVAQ